MVQTLVLFDIDGTLLSSDASGRGALRAAFTSEFADLGFFESVRFDGKTDPQIIRELFEAAGQPERATPANIQALLNRYLEHLNHQLAQRQVRRLPGVGPLLDALEADRAVCLGLLTGNLRDGARLKLGAAGIDFERFRLGAFGCDSARRPELPPIAASRAVEFFGRSPMGAEVVIIGDTPADVTCGASLGARAIGVATGSYTEMELHDAGAHATFATLESVEDVLEAIR